MSARKLYEIHKKNGRKKTHISVGFDIKSLREAII
jgi:hypothetical protein